MKQQKFIKSFNTASMFFICMLLSLVSMAQSSTRVSNAVDPVSVYLEKNTGSTLVNFYKANPDDPIAAKAVKYTVILVDENLSAGISQSDKDFMKKELLVHMQIISEVDALVKNGKTYDQAKAIVYRKGFKQLENLKHENSNQLPQPSATNLNQTETK